MHVHLQATVRTHAHTHARAHKHAHTCTHACTCARTCAHTHTDRFHVACPYMNNLHICSYRRAAMWASCFARTGGSARQRHKAPRSSMCCCSSQMVASFFLRFSAWKVRHSRCIEEGVKESLLCCVTTPCMQSCIMWPCDHIMRLCMCTLIVSDAHLSVCTQTPLSSRMQHLLRSSKRRLRWKSLVVTLTECLVS